MRQIWVEKGSNVGGAAHTVAISKDSLSYEFFETDGMSVNFAFLQGNPNPILNSYPYTNQCKINIHASNGTTISFDLQDIQNSPFTGYGANELGCGDAVKEISSWI